MLLLTLTLMLLLAEGPMAVIHGRWRRLFLLGVHLHAAVDKEGLRGHRWSLYAQIGATVRLCAHVRHLVAKLQGALQN